jgi:hypothetical protein
MKPDLLQLLTQALQWVEEAAKVLKSSEEKCLALGSQACYTADELEKFEALTSRFARLCDLLLDYQVFTLSLECNKDYCTREARCNNPYCTPEARCNNHSRGLVQ